MKKFEIPAYYKSSFIGRIKEDRKNKDRRKKDMSPTIMDFGSVNILLARHFGFCYGVENAIEVSYRAIEENPDNRIFLLSEMIHNQTVNEDLLSRGVRFLCDTSGNRLVDWNTLSKDDIVIVPAFGTTIETMEELVNIGVNVHSYNTTCPFVEKVWTRSNSLGESGHTVIIHGKYKHEETRATFSHTKKNAPSVVVLDMDEAKKLGAYINGTKDLKYFEAEFEEKFTKGFDPSRDFQKIGVVNQTTMLATETQEIADYFRDLMIEKYGEENIKDHYADTKDTLCYATNDNQQATLGLLNEKADLVLVVGGYNSSNTSHIVEILEEKFPTYFINSPDKIISDSEIHYFDYHNKLNKVKTDFLPTKVKPNIIVTSGASCPDKVVEEVILKILEFYPGAREVEDVMTDLLD